MLAEELCMSPTESLDTVHYSQFNEEEIWCAKPRKPSGEKKN
jgi:hypothetical protein